MDERDLAPDVVGVIKEDIRSLDYSSSNMGFCG